MKIAISKRLGRYELILNCKKLRLTSDHPLLRILLIAHKSELPPKISTDKFSKCLDQLNVMFL
ncbi:hypothetical protein L211DRAFT_843185 [Terfezia boudieri ATCC MYA-4762]|uniref:Uncharacterized protein n=1 Tax=Terfezia boudieri ATCC MYA-4762 TaxID=1051890 RepID=A0A3N4L7H9_9PEZI|nr:hypothetical protein L211DRAFT_843185 [Terfezia boudieri ATCC MYA-4762]